MPAEVASRFRRKEFVLSLRTKSLPEARLRAGYLRGELDHLFFRVGTDMRIDSEEAPARRFNRRLRDIGIDSPGKTIYSLRHTVITRLKYLDMQEWTISEVVGHVNENITSGRYGKKLDAPRLKDAVEQLEYRLGF